ncbi:MAG: hypothetical protein LUG56_07165 [Lachnospiraceae bacterium]|nr:hypothetical protein [Lachnospiraceae bacterium]MCD7842233.1 hypothetical protein [Lachnospiraceae bacterium]MCD8001468.1 hypothetical protein [Oscillospiraceae bacterium]
MQAYMEPDAYIISTCPRCGTRLMCGRVVVGGLQQCTRCKRRWLVELSAEQVIVTRAPEQIQSES